MSLQATYGLREHIEQMISEAPWWLGSAVAHVILIVVLATITFTTRAIVHRPIAPGGGLDPIEERIPLPPSEFDPLGPSTGGESPGLRSLEPRLGREYKDTLNTVSPLSLEGPGEALSAGSLSKAGPDSFSLFKPGSGRGIPALAPTHDATINITMSDAMDSLAASIVKAIQRDDLLVVLLFDESRSLLEDRKIVMQKIDRVMANLHTELTDKEKARLKWAVVGYGYKPALWLQPTDNVAKVLQSIRQIKIDETGVENVCAAISLAMKTLSPLRRKMYVVVITDEEGDDTHDEKAYAQALHDLRAANAKLFVFGRESLFQQQNAFEWLRDSKGERVGPWFWAQRGIESCRQEFFATDWLFNHYRGDRQVGAGVGCWSLGTMAEATKGTFFILSEVSSPYDEERLGQYKPEWVVPLEYNDRVLKSRMRTAMRRIIDDWQKVDPPPSLWQLDQLKKERDEAIVKGEKALKFVEGAIPEMESLRARRAAERFARQRWQANYDLLLAELYKFRFMLRDYLAALRNTRTAGFPKPKPQQRFNYYRILYSTALTEPHTGLRGVREWEQAKRALDQVTADYDGTPWAEAAKFEKRTMAPITIFPAFDVESTHHEGADGPPKS